MAVDVVFGLCINRYDLDSQYSQTIWVAPKPLAPRKLSNLVESLRVFIKGFELVFRKTVALPTTWVLQFSL